jgi:microcin C transport system ATP-binding protein
MSVQAQIVDLLRDIQKEKKLSYVFISHDLKVVRALASELIIMKQGKIVEHGRAADLFAAPQHDYTKSLFAAAFNIETPYESH